MPTQSNEVKFLNELQELMNKYNVVLTSGDDYDGDDKFCGTVFYFKGKDIHLSINELYEVGK